MEGLEGLHQLKELVLDKNRIKTLSETSFIAQSGLLELHLAENRIRELNYLEPLTELRKLFLTMNKLQVVSWSGHQMFDFIVPILQTALPEHSAGILSRLKWAVALFRRLIPLIVNSRNVLSVLQRADTVRRRIAFPCIWKVRRETVQS